MEERNTFPGDESAKAEDPIETALEAYRRAWFSGNRLDPGTFCQDHPECGPKLREKIEDFIYVAEILPGPVAGDEGKPSLAEGADDAAIGKVLGDFKIIREIGRGGMGVVYEAEQISLRRRVALKILSAHLRFSTDAVMKFRREAEAGGRQKHPGIISIYAVGEHEGIHYIAEELVGEGRTLADRLNEISEEGRFPKGYFRDTAQFAADAADALEQAHQSGVIHRDVKPSNILLTDEKRPKVTDFGLARIEDALALSRTGDLAGTPYYMSPEQALSRRKVIDKRTDVYSLGVTLYEMLTMRRPFEGETSQEILRKIMFMDPEDPHKVNPMVPFGLSVICLKAMEKDPDRRYQSMAEFAGDLRRFLSGDVILAKPAGPGTRIWKRVKRNPVWSTAVAMALASLVIFMGYVLFVSNPQLRHERDMAEKEKQKALAAEGKAVEAQKEAEELYRQVIRLSDIKQLTDLERTSNELWPAYPEMISQMKDWIGEVQDLAGRLPVHRERLDALQEEVKSTEDVGILWQHEVVQELVAGIERLIDEEMGTLKIIEERLSFASTIRKRSIDDHWEAWDHAISSIADKRECPMYGGLVIKQQIGLVPIGQDPESGLWEFAHLQTGEIPERGEDGKLVLTEGMGLIFVLIPGGTFNMGAVKASKENPLGSPNVNPRVGHFEGPIHEVTVKPFLFSKYEMTQGQWLRFTGENPSMQNPNYYALSWNRERAPISLLHPVDNVDWETCVDVLPKLKLRLPSEAEWEYSCRAGTTSVWWTGNEKKSLQGAANLCDQYCYSHQGNPDWSYEIDLDDGYTSHAPVGSFRPNGFGLHDVHGNINELCRDVKANYKKTPVDGSAFESDSEPVRIVRGGSFTTTAECCRSAFRGGIGPDTTGIDLGLRPACSLQ